MWSRLSRAVNIRKAFFLVSEPTFITRKCPYVRNLSGDPISTAHTAQSAPTSPAGTSRILEQHSADLTPAFVPSKANAEALSAELPQDTPDATVLYPASQRAQHTLQRGLEARHFRVTRLDTYSTEAVTRVSADALEAARRCAVVSVAAPSALKAWLQVAGEDAAKARPVACIGGTSVKAAARLGWPEERVFWPESPGLDGFVASIKDALAHGVRTRMDAP